MEKLVEWLGKHWFLLTAFFFASVAYGESTVKIKTLEEAVKQNSDIVKDIKELRSQVDKSEERSQAIAKSQERQERMIELLLTNQQSRLSIQQNARQILQKNTPSK